MNCNSCEQMKKENKQLRQALVDTNRNYVEVVNENLALRRGELRCDFDCDGCHDER